MRVLYILIYFMWRSDWVVKQKSLLVEIFIIGTKCSLRVPRFAHIWQVGVLSGSWGGCWREALTWPPSPSTLIRSRHSSIVCARSTWHKGNFTSPIWSCFEKRSKSNIAKTSVLFIASEYGKFWNKARRKIKTITVLFLFRISRHWFRKVKVCLEQIRQGAVEKTLRLSTLEKYPCER